MAARSQKPVPGAEKVGDRRPSPVDRQCRVTPASKLRPLHSTSGNARGSSKMSCSTMWTCSTPRLAC
ncbi:hypothetical protein FKM82_026302 [Ascaphus truei]